MDISIDEKKLSTFRRYYLEFSVLILATAIGFTVRFVIKLNDKYTDYIILDNKKSIIQIEKSTDALNNNTEVLRDIKTVLKEKK